MRLINETKLDFDDVLILPKRSTLTSREEVDLFRNFSFKYSSVKYFGIPVMATNMSSVATIKAALALQSAGMFTCLHKFIGQDNNFAKSKELKPENFAITLGLNDKPAIKNFDYLCLDVANGYTESFVSFVKKMRSKYPEKVIIAGNVCTPEMTEELILSGADIVKIGIGPGSGCLTREKTGVGYPQLSAVIEAADAAHGLKGHIIADGGCRVPADIAKAFAAGADFVMLGGMLAAHDENSWPSENGKSTFFGMSSNYAMNVHSNEENQMIRPYRTSEGRVVELDVKGPLSATIQDILGSLRSTCTYVGAKSLKELSKRTTFVRVNNQLNRVYANQTVGQ